MSKLTFREFQAFINEHYTAHDAQRGTAGTFLWFMEEMGELASALQRVSLPGHKATPQERQNLEEEFADVLGWLSTLANIHSIDLESAVRHKYLESSDLESHKP